MKSRIRIAFVCTGNTGRSAVAEPFARRWCETQDQAADIVSRGVAPTPGQFPAEPEATAQLATRGVDISTHRATAFTQQDADECDLILTATNAHKAILCHRHPHAGTKTFTMSEYVTGDNTDIADAFGQDEAFYRHVIRQIELAIDPILQRALGCG